jgi:hypothetical protein
VTDPDLVLKKLAVIETCVRELRQMARPDALVEDIKERRFVEHTAAGDPGGSRCRVAHRV